MSDYNAVWYTYGDSSIFPILASFIRFTATAHVAQGWEWGWGARPFLRCGEFWFCKSVSEKLWITLIFVMCLHSSATVTPDKYECDILQVILGFINLKKTWKVNGTEKWFSTSTPVLLFIYSVSLLECIHGMSTLALWPGCQICYTFVIVDVITFAFCNHFFNITHMCKIRNHTNNEN